MRSINFSKWHGCGNDFILIDARASPALAKRRDWPRLAKAWCPRHTGIGADQLLLLTKPRAVADVALRIYNADGSQAAMCGNGLRCVGRFVAEAARGRKESVGVEVGGRVLSVRIATKRGQFTSATVGMGQPEREAARIPVISSRPPVGIKPPREAVKLLRGAGYGAAMTCIGMGNPHAVFFGSAGGEPADEMDRIARAGAVIEHCAMFPERTNVQFTRVMSRGRLRVRTWERGAGVTLACGSGACAAAVAAMILDLADREVDVELLGGTVRVAWDSELGVTLTGPAEHVNDGRVAVNG